MRQESRASATGRFHVRNWGDGEADEACVRMPWGVHVTSSYLVGLEGEGLLTPDSGNLCQPHGEQRGRGPCQDLAASGDGS